MAIDKKIYVNKIKSNLWADKYYQVFYYDFNLEGRKYRGLINLSDKMGWGKRDKVAVAEGELIKIKNDKRTGIADSSVSLDSYVNMFFDKLDASDGYVKTRRSHYDRYVSPLIGGKKLISIRQAHIRECVKYQEDKGLAPRTIKQTMEVLNPTFKDAIANRLIQFNPTDGIKIKLPQTKKIVTHATTKLKQIYNAIQEEFYDNPFYFAIFLFALQGRRKSEILTLRWEDVSFTHSYYVLRNTKNNEEQKIYLPENIKEQLIKFNEVEGWVFESRVSGSHMKDVRKAVDKIKTRLGDDTFGLHYLRNVIVGAMAESGFDSIHLSGALGHNDPNTIKKYLTMNYLKSSEMASGVIDGIIERKV